MQESTRTDYLKMADSWLGIIFARADKNYPLSTQNRLWEYNRCLQEAFK
jgi:hypothetical protein